MRNTFRIDQNGTKLTQKMIQEIIAVFEVGLILANLR